MKIKSRKDIHNHIFDERSYQNLKPNKIYQVIGIDYDNFRIINEIGEPILYPKELFEIIDPEIPDTWIIQNYSDDEYYIDPPELCAIGFYEDFFDGKTYAIDRLRNFLNKLNFH